MLLGALLSITAVPAVAQTPRDGAHDFDWEIGTWATSLRYLANPLTGAPPRWIAYAGSTVVRPAMDGQSNLVELDVAAASSHIRGLSLRLYDPQAHQWSLNFANIRNGKLTQPMHGAFDAAGRGLFYGVDDVDGRVVLVRFVITPEGRGTVRFVQSYSADAGATWEDNWIAIDRRR